MPDDQNWRLQATLDSRDGIEQLVEQLSAHDEVLGTSVNGALPPGVEISHDGDALFAYASTKLSVDGARSAIERMLYAEGRKAELRVSRWDADVEAWRQVEPPLTAEELALEEARVAAATRIETRTFSYVIGRFERRQLEGAIADYAQANGLDRTITHRNLLLFARLTIMVSGPAVKLDDFQEHARWTVARTGDGSAGP